MALPIKLTYVYVYIRSLSFIQHLIHYFVVLPYTPNIYLLLSDSCIFHVWNSKP